MIFMNQSGMGRYGSDSKLDSGDYWSTSQKAVFGAILAYVLISAILFFFHYPVSCLAIIVPICLFIVTTIINKVGSGEDLMFCTIVAVINALIKLSAIIVYISAFNLNDHNEDSRYVSRTSSSSNGDDGEEDLPPPVSSVYQQTDPKRIFFYALVGVEAAIVFLILFLRCNLRMCRSNIT
ncbi:hypothetical protein M3Y97_01081800 [Aphelenchoides bicaudatus]|nr:hypothetical protein M3Y97_01081800 [Aphelenchoides bicaudatus]